MFAVAFGSFATWTMAIMSDRQSRTENVPAIVGFGKTAELVRIQLNEQAKRMRKLCDYLKREIERRIPFVILDAIPRSASPRSVISASDSSKAKL